ncbi:MAG: DNA cytosine methyltransferase [Cyclobacteriaceae bacterium]|jgi:DNA (cytosine-5)-methyltransferase 1
MQNKPTVVSLYSGAGGIDIGFHKAGFEILLSTDNWKVACETLEKNKINGEVVCDDVRNIDFKKFKKRIKRTVDVVVGGPPCPPFSKSRFYRVEKKRGLDDENAFTVSEYFRAVEELQPKVFLFENVHGFVYKPHIEALNYVIERSEELGYKISYRVVNAADYGVPQTRERFICVGVKKSLKSFDYPEPTHSEKNEDGLKPWVTCGDILSEIDFDLPEDEKMEAGSKHKGILKLIPPGDNYLYFTKERGHKKPLFKWRSRYWSFLLKLSPDRPSWTIQASHSNNMGPFHWKNRFLRIQEIKRIQTFDDNYFLSGNFRDQWRQVGNAVPPTLVKVFAKAIKKQYFSLNANSIKVKQYAEASTS